MLLCETTPPLDGVMLYSAPLSLSCHQKPSAASVSPHEVILSLFISPPPLIPSHLCPRMPPGPPPSLSLSLCRCPSCPPTSSSILSSLCSSPLRRVYSSQLAVCAGYANTPHLLQFLQSNPLPGGLCSTDPVHHGNPVSVRTYQDGSTNREVGR